MEKTLKKKAKQKVNAKHGFYVISAIFASISFILYTVSLNFQGSTAYWIQFPILVLMMVLGIIYVSIFGISLDKPFNPTWKEEEIAKEMARLSLGIHSDTEPLDEEDEWGESESFHYQEWNG